MDVRLFGSLKFSWTCAIVKKFQLNTLVLVCESQCDEMKIKHNKHIKSIFVYNQMLNLFQELLKHI